MTDEPIEGGSWLGTASISNQLLNLDEDSNDGSHRLAAGSRDGGSSQQQLRRGLDHDASAGEVIARIEDLVTQFITQLNEGHILGLILMPSRAPVAAEVRSCQSIRCTLFYLQQW